MQLHGTAPTSTLHLTSRTGALRRTMPVAAATAVIAMCGFLVSGTPALAQSGEGRCSNRTLSGNYACSVQGVLLVGPPGGALLELQFVGVTTTDYDGNGNLTSLEHTVINGQVSNPGWLAASGTYAVNPDCTGTAVVNTPNSPVPLNLWFVLADKGAEIRQVLDAHALVTICHKVR